MDERSHVSRELVDSVYQLIDQVHIQLINQSGGEQGIRDDSGLQNSIYRVLQRVQRFPKDPSKIACFTYKEFARRHHFNDGNKRTAHVVANIALFLVGYQFTLEYEEATKFIIQLAAYNSIITDKQIIEWIKKELKPIDSKDIGKYLKEIMLEM